VLLTAPVCLHEPLIQLAVALGLWFFCNETFLLHVESHDFLCRKYIFCATPALQPAIIVHDRNMLRFENLQQTYNLEEKMNKE